MRHLWTTLPAASLAVLLLLGDAAVAQTSALTWREAYLRRPPVGMRVSMDILVDGKPMRTISHKGTIYLPVATLGTEYEIRVRNDGPRRITAIVSVDGLSVITGKPASENDTGYLVDARSSIVIKGWRRNLDTVAAFGFVEPKKSYAARIGYPENVGVIGLVAFEELPRPILRPERRPFLKQAAKDARAKASAGTGYGRDIDSRVSYVPFVRSTNKVAVTYHYDTIQALRKAGVPVAVPTPVPFPKDSEFAQPPPAYRGK